jgi:hypothetical protein
MTIYAAIDLPPGIRGVTKGDRRDLERLNKEVEIVRLPDWDAFPGQEWGREAFFGCKASAVTRQRRLLAYSRAANGRIVRGWYLTFHDRCFYRDSLNCPSESAWLATIAPGKPSEPAWLYLRP